MKIKKSLIEAVVDPIDELDELDIEAPIDVDMENDSKNDIKADILAGAAEAGVAIDEEDLEEETKVIYKATDLIENPYGTAQPNKIEEALQAALEQSLSDREVGLRGDYPNVIIYGQAGFGKTAIVEEFCEKHRLNLVEIDAKNMAPETIGGIPYIIENNKGEKIQMPIPSATWNALKNDNVIIFLDEFNRANGRAIGSMLTLINNHKLPASKISKETGSVEVTKFYKNVLFCVIAFNPASSIFPDANKLDPAVISRNAAIVHQEPNIPEYKKYVDGVYDKILANQNLSQRARARYSGQKGIMDALLTNPAFHFDDQSTIEKIYGEQSRGVYNYLNYRSLFLVVKNCDGTKNNFLNKSLVRANFWPDTTQRIKNCLANYQDTQTTGNNIWTSSSRTTNPTSAEQKTDSEAQSALDMFANSLDDDNFSLT